MLQAVRQLEISYADEHLIEDDVVGDFNALELVKTFGKTTRDIATAVDEVGDARATE